MNKKQIVGAVVAAVLFIVIGVSSVLTNMVSKGLVSQTEEQVKNMLSGGVTMDAPDSDYIGIVSVVGTIQEQTTSTSLTSAASGQYQHTTMMEYIDSMMTDDNNTGILLYVDSPGGTVYEAEEMHNKLVEYKETTGRPVWTYMAHYAASGGYMVSAPSDKIYANTNTTTGSIGVILSGYDMSGLYEKLGIKQVNITSGVNKATTWSDEEVQIYQDIVNEYYDRFVEKVANGRHMTVDQVKELADGRIYSATQAKNNGLIDEISTYDDMQSAMSDELGCSDFYEPEESTSVLSTLFASAKELVPKSEAEVLVDVKEEFGSGVPLYYAEQLQ